MLELSRDEIERGNRLIAEYIGFQYTKIGWYDYNEVLNLSYTEDNTFDEMKFHISYDWIMPVVKKILSQKFKGCVQCDIKYHLEHSSIEELFRAVVEFIMWYNLWMEKKKKK